MYVRQLTEAEYNFGDQAAETFDKVGKLAAGAYGKFKGAYQKSQDDLKRQAELADKKKKGSKAPAGAANAVEKSIIQTVVNDTPTTDTVGDLEQLDASEFAELPMRVKELEMRADKVADSYRTALKTSDMITVDNKKNIDDLFKVPATAAAPAAARLANNVNGEIKLWTDVLSTDDDAEMGKLLLAQLRRVSELNQAYNQSIHTQMFNARGGKKPPAERPFGTRLIAQHAAELELIKQRLTILKGVISKIENKPIEKKAPAEEPVKENLRLLAELAYKRF